MNPDQFELEACLRCLTDEGDLLDAETAFSAAGWHVEIDYEKAKVYDSDLRRADHKAHILKRGRDAAITVIAQQLLHK